MKKQNKNNFGSSSPVVITITNRQVLTALQSILTDLPSDLWYETTVTGDGGLGCSAIYGFYSFGVGNATGGLCGSQNSNPMISWLGPWTLKSPTLGASAISALIGQYIEFASTPPNNTFSGPDAHNHNIIVYILDDALQIDPSQQFIFVNPTIVQVFQTTLQYNEFGATFLAMKAAANAITNLITTYPDGSLGALVQQITSTYPTTICTANDGICFEQAYLGIFTILKTLLSLQDTDSYNATWYSTATEGSPAGYTTVLYDPINALMTAFATKNPSPTLEDQKNFVYVLNGVAFVRTAIEQLLKSYPPSTETVFTDISHLTQCLVNSTWCGQNGNPTISALWNQIAKETAA